MSNQNGNTRPWRVLKADRKKLKEMEELFRYPEFINSILINRGIDTEEKVLRYTKPSVLDMHSPFYFRDMEKAILRIEKALENKEAILIFGDKDVDGVTATAMVHKYLSKLDANIAYRVPEGSDNYGISKDVIQWAAMNDFSLIITVDCGITSLDEIDYANTLNIDIIVTDHHEPRERLPKAYAIINPKVTDDSYPFFYLSGASVAFKLLCAMTEKSSLRDYYNQEIIFFDIETTGLNPARDEIIEIGAVRMKNGVPMAEFQCLIKPHNPVSAEITNLTGISNDMLEKEGISAAEALERFLLFIGNSKLVGHNAVEFDLKFIQNQLKKVLDKTINNPVEDTLKMARVMARKVNDHKLNTVAQSVGYFVDTSTLHRSVQDSILCAEVYRRLIIQRTNKLIELYEENLPLAAIGSIADIMPLIGENRIIVKNGLKLIPHAPIGLISLLRSLNMNVDRIVSREVSWNISPVLNSPGRMGDASYSVELLMSNKIKEAEELVQDIISKDSARKNVVDDSVEVVNTMIDKDAVMRDKIIVLASEEFSRGTTGLLANRYCNQYGVPAVIIAIDKTNATGSVRALSGFDIGKLLDNVSQYFLQFGGHKSAGGFTLKTENIEKLKVDMIKYMENFEHNDLSLEMVADAELTNLDELNVSMIRYLENILEPTGNMNEIPKIYIPQIKINFYRDIGKTGDHALLTIQKNTRTMTVTGWNWSKKLREMLAVEGARTALYDIIASPEINKYQGNEEAKLNLVDIRKSI